MCMSVSMCGVYVCVCVRACMCGEGGKENPSKIAPSLLLYDCAGIECSSSFVNGQSVNIYWFACGTTNVYLMLCPKWITLPQT